MAAQSCGAHNGRAAPKCWFVHSGARSCGMHRLLQTFGVRTTMIGTRCSAVNLKFLSLLAASSFRNFKFKTALEIIKLLVVLRFRSLHLNVTRALANFGIGPLVRDAISEPLKQRHSTARMIRSQGKAHYMSKVTLHTDGNVGVLSLTNPPLNLWDKGLLADWKSAVDQAARTPMRALVVRAEGSIFSGGADVSIFRDVSTIEGREMF